MKAKLTLHIRRFVCLSALMSCFVAAFLSGCKKSPVGLIPSQRATVHPNFGGAVLTSGLRPQLRGELPTTSDELWILARSSEAPAPQADDNPGSGALMAQLEEKQIPMPLKHTDVRASVSGYLGSVQVVQQFHNPYDTKIEAVYVFPLPHNAAVNEFIMTIGDRRIRGIIRERQEAEEIYQAAKRQIGRASCRERV